MNIPVLSLLRGTLRRNRKNEMFKMVTALGVVSLLGIGVAAAAISLGPGTSDPSMRPLSTAPGLIVTRAFGDDDEDCTTATRPDVLNGHLRLSRQLVCEQ